MAEAKEDDASKKSGYTYWKRDIDDAHVLPDNRPQKLEGETTKETPKDAVGSSWNSAGTWEEKDTTAPARAELEKILTDETFALLDADGNKVIGCTATITGDSQAYHIRGRPRLGFEFQVKLSWKGSFEGKEVSGDLDIQDLDSSDLDGFDIRPKPKNSDSKAAAEALKKSARPAIKKAAELLTQRMLAR
ncbi:unnamed protein product [Effrenium voratum]|uniref:Activator of Hsp90 ATPase AHSA1-like N-terminal domain-containing protein n=1 Tax=Effrenium voratum TaxID=2562239 RepID=A0AA36HU47_9DINO|nr:unnamed protein product [Effrenium voratum]CAJ1417081.1 unnamed protein product [Effrenium voratum]|mmetsp:Transcript_37585/g.89744  ORF Transcript_37585/g.89744 Transcript_37585/m.89744 type:complete len:190 (-) Transcript_37585:116-685(-)